MKTMVFGCLTSSLAIAVQLANVEESRADRLYEAGVSSGRAGEGFTQAHAGRAQRSIDMVLDGPLARCEDGCGPRPARGFSALPAVLLRELGEVPVLGAVIMPVTEGVTFTPFDGLPPVTFAVKPTKFTRGSGFVAIGTF